MHVYIATPEYKGLKSNFYILRNLQYSECTYICLVLHSKPSLIDIDV